MRLGLTATVAIDVRYAGAATGAACAAPRYLSISSASMRVSSERGSSSSNCQPDVQRILDAAVFLKPLVHESLFELLGEGGVLAVDRGQRRLPQHHRQLARVAATGVSGEQLVGHSRMILARAALADTLLHQPRQRRQHVDRRFQALAVQRAAQDHLSLGDVPGQVGDRVGLVILRHAQNRHLGDRPALALDAPRPFVDQRQVGVHVAGIGAPARHLLACRRDLAQRVAVVGHVGEDHQYVHVAVERQVLRRGEGHARDRDALDHRVVGQVDEQHGPLDGSGAPKILHEEVGFLEGDAHRREHHRERLLAVQRPRLARDLRRQLGVRQSGPRKNRQLLAAHQGQVAVDGRNAGLDELLGKVARVGIDRRAVDVAELLRDHVAGVIQRFADAVQDPSQHLARHPCHHPLAGEAHRRQVGGDPLRRLEQLHHGASGRRLQHLAAPHRAVRQFDVGQLAVGYVVHLFHDHQRPIQAACTAVFLDH